MISEEEKLSLHSASGGRRFFSLAGRLLLWCLGAMLVLYLCSFFFVGPLARHRLEKLTSGSAYIKSGCLTGVGGIRLKGVLLGTDADSLSDNPVLRADRIDIGFSALKLFTGKFEIHSIRISDFLVTADYESEKDRWNFQRLSIRKGSDGSGGIPLIQADKGALQCYQSTAAKREILTTIGLNGQIAVDKAADQYHFTFRTDDRFDFGDSVIEGTFKADTEGGLNHLALSGQILMSGTKIGDNSWDIRDIRLDCQFNQQQILLHRCGFSLGGGALDITGSIVHESGSPMMDLKLDVRELKLANHYSKDAVVYSQSILNRMDPDLRDFLEQYQPAGSVNIQMALKGWFEDLGKMEASGRVQCLDISVCDAKFPYQLEHVQGEIELNGRNLNIKALQAKHGPVDLEIQGNIENMGPKALIDLRITSPNLKFEDDLKAALSKPNQMVWFAFLPTGTTGLEYHYLRLPNGEKEKTMEFNLKKAGATYKHFPYPLENLTGTIRVESSQIQLKHLQAVYDDGRKVGLDGQVYIEKDKEPNFKIQLIAEQIPVDKQLIEAMPEEQRAFLKKLNMDAVADLKVDLFSSDTGAYPVDYIAHIDLNGKSLRYEDFPIPVTDLKLKVDITHDWIRIHEYDGLAAGSKLRMSGEIYPRGIQSDEPAVCLDLDLREFELDETFWRAMGSKAQRYLGGFRADGNISVTGRLAVNAPEGSCQSNDLKVQFGNNFITWQEQYLGHARGNLYLRKDYAAFEKFSFTGIDLEKIPLEMLSEKNKMLYASVNPKGNIDVTFKQGIVVLGDENLESFDMDVGINFRNFTYGQKEIVQDLTGALEGDIQIDRSSKTLQTAMQYDIEHLYYRNWKITDIRGDLKYFPRDRRFVSDNVSAYLYDGSILGGFAINLQDPNDTHYSVDVKLSDINVHDFLMAGHDPQGDEIKEGLASGQVSLKVPFSNLKRPDGNITVYVKDMKLGKQSVLGKILTTIQFKQPENFIFSELEFDALVNGPELDCRRVRIVGKPLLFYGSGDLNLDSHQVRMQLVSFDRIIGKEDDILNMLARGIGSALWKIEINGDIKDPKVDAVFLSVLKSPLDIFKKKKE